MKIVITGGPGSGKSSLIKELEGKFTVVPEVARHWIDFFTEHVPHLLPWNNREFFQTLMDTIQLKNYLEHNDGDFVFDRGLVDEVVYHKFFTFSIPEILREQCLRHRYDKVFFLPFWPEIYQNDSVRVETVEEAQRLDSLTRECYKEMGYELIEIPKTSVDERVKFILEVIKDEHSRF